VNQFIYTQQHITLCTGLQNKYCQYHNKLCIKPITQKNTSLSVLVSGTITVGNAMYSVSSQFHTITLHCQYCSAVQLLSISQYTLYQSSFTQQHFTLSKRLRYNYCQYQYIHFIKPVTHNTSMSEPVCDTITVNITI
jgi:hypothetical protein